jgi:uncharacterized membrane protein HdeD (DUF308 family)
MDDQEALFGRSVVPTLPVLSRVQTDHSLSDDVAYASLATPANRSLRTLILFRAALNALFGIYFLASPTPSRIEGFVQIGYYALADGAVALLLAFAMHRAGTVALIFGLLLMDALVRLACGIFIMSAPALGFLTLTRVMFASAVVTIAFALGVSGIVYSAGASWWGRQSIPQWTRRMTFLTSACTVLFAVALAFSSETRAHVREVMGGYVLALAISLLVASLPPPRRHKTDKEERGRPKP